MVRSHDHFIFLPGICFHKPFIFQSRTQQERKSTEGTRSSNWAFKHIICICISTLFSLAERTLSMHFLKHIQFYLFWALYNVHAFHVFTSSFFFSYVHSFLYKTSIVCNTSIHLSLFVKFIISILTQFMQFKFLFVMNITGYFLLFLTFFSYMLKFSMFNIIKFSIDAILVTTQC